MLRDYHAGAPPITSDPPVHTWARRLLLPPFSIQAVAQYEPETRELCASLIDGFIDKGRADAAVDYAQQIPPRVIASMLGHPEGDGRHVHGVGARLPGVRPDERRHAAARPPATSSAISGERIQERKEKPDGDDLISYLLARRGRRRAGSRDRTSSGTCFLMLVAGIDTTWSSIGSALWHLAQHPEDRARLVAEPELMPTAVEELLRAYSPVTMARVVDGGRRVRRLQDVRRATRC